MQLPLPKVIEDVGPGGPVVTALQGMNTLAHNQLKTKYYPQDIESQINNRNALTEGQKIENQYMPDKLRLANALAQLTNQYYAPNMQSEINQRNALTKKYNTMTPLEAKELELKNEWYPKTEQANINWKNSGGSSGGVGQQELRAFQAQLANEHPEWSPEQITQAAGAYLSGDSSLPSGEPLPPLSGVGQSYVDQIIKRGTTAQGLNQQRFAATTDAILKEGKKLIPTVAQYAGALGKAQGNIDSVANSLGADSPAYQDYIYFTRTFVPFAAGEMMRALGVNASDTQKKLYQEVVNPISWDSNPSTALRNYNKMADLFQKTASKTVGKTTGEIRSSLRNNSSQNEQQDAAYEGDYNKPMGSIAMIDKDGKLGEKNKLYFIPSNEVAKWKQKGLVYDKR